MNSTQSFNASVAATISTENSTKRSPSHSRSPEKKAESVWVTAVDPASQRRYWYNRYDVF